MKCICLIQLENLQCNLRSLENVNNEEREMLHDDNELGEMFIFAASFVKNPDTYTNKNIIEMNNIMEMNNTTNESDTIH